MTRLLIPIKLQNSDNKFEKNDFNEVEVETNFENAAQYLIVDTISNDINVITNTTPYYEEKDILSTIAITNRVNVVLAIQIDRLQYISFKFSGIPVYRVEETLSIKSALENYERGKLRIMSFPRITNCCQ
ncbi:MAG: hypothetical protein ACXAC2_02145 [Candidatus Kariarchaeaceae archaeon]|jgi:predicted Fe-Mo cluster-binding NifX family protein